MDYFLQVKKGALRAFKKEFEDKLGFTEPEVEGKNKLNQKEVRKALNLFPGTDVIILFKKNHYFLLVRRCHVETKERGETNARK